MTLHDAFEDAHCFHFVLEYATEPRTVHTSQCAFSVLGAPLNAAALCACVQQASRHEALRTEIHGALTAVHTRLDASAAAADALQGKELEPRTQRTAHGASPVHSGHGAPPSF